uniref:Putative adenylate cyclase regulatory protein n=1 Tax=Trypanosoma equiperdum TaxID=5694 RepID=ESA8C_TRYEQ|nr:RecName: Full=Putative adenylate cyclase regulatory protein [Trypanosoma equiperdum]CAA42028.1 eESAG8c [Trypanosoma equiperdum]
MTGRSTYGMCAVCREPWAEGALELFPCRHVFCTVCVVERWRCPSCQRRIGGRRKANPHLLREIAEVTMELKRYRKGRSGIDVTQMARKLGGGGVTTSSEIFRRLEGSKNGRWKILNLSGCGSELQDLTALRDLEALEDLDLSECANLELRELMVVLTLRNLRKLRMKRTMVNDMWCSSIGLLKFLVHLEVDGSRGVTDITGLCRLKTLEALSLDSCINITKGFDKICALPQLTSLSLCQTNVTDKDLRCIHPDGKLKVLRYSSCHEITDLTAIGGMRSLEKLSLSGCWNVTKGLEELCKFSNLRELDISGCLVLGSAVVLKNLINLKVLSVSNCKNFKDLNGLERLVNLDKLNLSGCHGVSSLGFVANLSNLKELDISGCESLVCFDGLQDLNNLEVLYLRDVKSFTNVGAIKNLSKMRELDLSGCERITSLSGLETLKGLEELSLEGCGEIMSFDPIWSLHHLRVLYVSECGNLEDLSGLEGITGLEELYLHGCRKCTNFGPIWNLRNVCVVELSCCENLEDLSGLQCLTGLEELYLIGCEEITPIGVVGNLRNLKCLSTCWCANLKELGGLDRLVNLEKLDLSGCCGLSSSVFMELMSLPKLQWFYGFGSRVPDIVLEELKRRGVHIF